MKLSWSQLRDIFKAEFVCGEMIAKVEGRRQVIGKRINGEVQLNPLGERLAITTRMAIPVVTSDNTTPTPPSTNPSAPPPARRYVSRRKKVVEPDA